MIRGAATLTLVGGTVTALILTGHHPHRTRPASSGSAPLAPVVHLPQRHASRAEVRPPLPGPTRTPVKPRQRQHLRLVSSLADVTMYCPTGNRNAAGRWPQAGDVAVLDRSIPFGTRLRIGDLGVYTVEDWIGSGSRFDIFDDDADCETTALAFGRRHLRVVEVGR